MRRDDEAPAAAGLPQAVQEEIRLRFEPVRSEGLAGPHGDTARSWAKGGCQERLQVTPLGLAVELGERIEAGLAQDMDLGIRAAGPRPGEREIPFP
ncbi:hypothetical protein Slala04_66270 [Streptomyces lavendulae subsp. lavendulae]|nr:hypothetical protein Slala04_66270 [Streptomyces lavendulae subsp. lavendulae]